MKILVDSREVRPLKFDIEGTCVTEVVVTKLDVGDYGGVFLDGEVCPIFFERKSLGDCYGTMTSGHARFKRELRRAKAANVKLILAIEGTPGEVAAGYVHSRFPGPSMIKKLATLWLKYDLVPMFFDSRTAMAAWIIAFYESFGRLYKMRSR